MEDIMDIEELQAYFLKDAPGAPQKSRPPAVQKPSNQTEARPERVSLGSAIFSLALLLAMCFSLAVGMLFRQNPAKFFGGQAYLKSDGALLLVSPKVKNIRTGDSVLLARDRTEGRLSEITEVLPAFSEQPQMWRYRVRRATQQGGQQVVYLRNIAGRAVLNAPGLGGVLQLVQRYFFPLMCLFAAALLSLRMLELWKGRANHEAITPKAKAAVKPGAHVDSNAVRLRGGNHGGGALRTANGKPGEHLYRGRSGADLGAAELARHSCRPDDLRGPGNSERPHSDIGGDGAGLRLPGSEDSPVRHTYRNPWG
jgi:hypothetical protein